MKAMNCDETNSRNLPKDWKSDLMIPKDCGLVFASFAKLLHQRCSDLLGPVTWSWHVMAT